MYNYEELQKNIKAKKEEDFKALKAEISEVESFFEKCFRVIFESTSSKAERDFNVTSL